ncbi:hypothetical protein CPC08DRAFT_744281 [Agrocybe pediades]|nr:hypothetical protein CPC08DRAFT_744281 [Agrocybe pediades]
MLRKSDLAGFTIKGEVEHLITTLFADDTTVWLAENDNFQDLQDILIKWCRTSGAKFNVAKTVVIPVGSELYRRNLLHSRKMSDQGTPLPPEIYIASDGTPVRVLGAYVGNKLDQVAVWTPTIDKITQRLERWSLNHPTQEGRCLVVGMFVGGLTQYLTRVQGMSTEIEEIIRRKITTFMWDGGTPMVNANLMSRDHPEGGRRVLNIKARNEAINLMKLQRYLTTTNRPKETWSSGITVDEKKDPER